MRLADRLVMMAAAGGPATAPATPPKVDYWALQEVNKEVNGGPYRDCEWFNHFKRLKLKEMGIPSEKLYVSTENGDGKTPNHVVTVVGDYVLDNRHRRVMTRKEMERGGYKAFPDYQITPGSTKP